MNPKSDKFVATHISDRKKHRIHEYWHYQRISSTKKWINQLISETIPVVIPPTPRIVDVFAASSGSLHEHQTISFKEIVIEAAHIDTRFFKDYKMVNWKDTDGTIPREGNTVRMVGIFTTPVIIGVAPSVYPTRMGSQEIGIPSRSIGPQEVRDSQPLDTSINGISAKYICCRLSDEFSAGIYLLFQMNLTSDSVLAKSTKSVNLRISYVHTADTSGPSSSSLPESEGVRMDPNVSRLAILLVELQRIE